MLATNDRSITPADLFRLEKFMCSGACGEDSMGLSRAHGFLTAAVSGPETVMPDEWIRLVFDEPVFVDAAQADDILDLIMRLYRDIARNLPQQGVFTPVFDIVRDADGSENFSADEWCLGYVSGMSLAGDVWAEHAKHELGEMLTPIFIIVSPEDTEEGKLREERYGQLCSMLPGVAEAIYQYWLARRPPAN
jgi:yecA family protein